MPTESNESESVEPQGWRCLITGKCTQSKMHRKCTGKRNGNMAVGPCHNYGHCYDCCDRCKAGCIEPPKGEVDYDLPDGEQFD